MPHKYNPFQPDKIVNPSLFCGRLEELDTVEHCLLQTKHDNPKHFLIEGERGIGKSSLFFFEQLVASGELETLDDGRLNFIVVSVSLYDSDDQFGIIKRIATELKRQLADLENFKSVALAALDHISRIEACGVRYNRANYTVEDDELLANLQVDLVRILTGLDETVDGVLLLIDEADKPPESARLGLLTKQITEELTRKRCERLCIGLAGLPGLVQKLKGSHESSPRIFTALALKPRNC